MKIHNAFVRGTGSSGPKKMCEICKLYFRWHGKRFCCPQCGSASNAEEIIGSTRKILKADVARPIIRNTKQQKKDRLAPDLPQGAHLISDD